MAIFPRTIAVSYYLAVEYQKLLMGRTLRQVRLRRNDRCFLFGFAGETDYLLEFSFAPPRFLLKRECLKPGDSFEIWPEVAGFRVANVSGRRDNRLIDFRLEGETEVGEQEIYIARFELFGALSNAYLLSEAGSIEHATRVIADKRALRPGMEYVEPEALKPLKQIGEALIFESDSATYKLHYQRHIHQVIAEVKPSKLAFKPDHRQPLTSLFQGLAAGEVSERRIDRSSQKLVKRLKREIAKLRARIQQLRERLAKCAEAEKYRQWGDLLMANPHAVPAAGEVRVQDLYNEGEISIPLKPGKSVIESAAAYYRLAKKLARAPEHLNKRIAAAKRRLQELERATKQMTEDAEPEQVREIAAKLGMLREGRPRSSEPQDESLPYREFRAPGGEKIMVGKSAADNDTLTFRIARSYDYWFHTQQSRGSHVILVVQDKNQKPGHSAIETAAALAAYYSDERKGDHVPVIYTQRRHVRKARKGAPGLVIPDRVESIFVTPRLPATMDANRD